MAFYFEDLHVGMKFSSASHTIDTEQIIAFARQFDPQPFHLDEQAAQNSLFKGLAASGWHTAAITMRLLVTGEAQLVGGMVGAGGTAEWPMPTRPGDTLRVESEVLELRPSRSNPTRGTVVLQSLTYNQHDEVVQKLVANVMAQRRPAQN